MGAARYLSGAVRFEHESAAATLHAVEEAFGCSFTHRREDPEAGTDDYQAHALGVTLLLELGPSSCVLTYRTQHLVPADVRRTLDLDDHIVAVLSTAGIDAEPLRR